MAFGARACVERSPARGFRLLSLLDLDLAGRDSALLAESIRSFKDSEDEVAPRSVALPSRFLLRGGRLS